MATGVSFYDHEVVQRMPDQYVEIKIAPDRILMAWQDSQFSIDFLNSDGSVKTKEAMSDAIFAEYLKVYETLKRGEELAKPVIGIGIMDNIEIGIGRDIVVAAQQLSLDTIPVHIRTAQSKDVKKLLNMA